MERRDSSRPRSRIAAVARPAGDRKIICGLPLAIRERGQVIEMLDCRPIGAIGRGRRRNHRLLAIDAFNVTSPNRAFDLRWNSEFVHTYLL